MFDMYSFIKCIIIIFFFQQQFLYKKYVFLISVPTFSD